MSFQHLLKKDTNPINKQIALELENCLAKTYKDNNNTVFGRTVFNHCEIVGYVARSLLSRIPEWLRENFFPSGSELIAAAHDIGKVCPSFQEKIRRAIKDYPFNSCKGLENTDPDLEKNWGYHAGISQLTAQYCKIGKYIPEILGQHHGYSPKLESREAIAEPFGGKEWQAKREELIEQLKIELQCEWPKVTSDLQAKMLAGLTTISDWIGSGHYFDDPGNKNWKQMIGTALDNAGFISPEIKKNLSFEDIFGISPYPIQQQLVTCCTEQGVYILEAPMGIGKTEAALYAAYKMIESYQATGIYFALPTQLTSDKIHERFCQFLEKILTPSSANQRCMLLHGSAWLKETELGEEGSPGGSWFQTNKRGLLAPFGVGTIDQALMAVMDVKHGFVRTFGLAGKVVILDEVHSYDSYTGTIIDALIEVLRALKCTVIILSATLTQDRRQVLLKHKPESDAYPLISCVKTGKLEEIPAMALAEKTSMIHMCYGDEEAIEEALERARTGQQVLWIENTVAEAQQQYKRLSLFAPDLGISCGLLHSRYIKHDRYAIEEKWVNLYGKNNTSRRNEQGRILIGTQILEQSLDIDADFIVTRLCPTDMLLQRLGRLWRHKQNDQIRPKGAQREAWLLPSTPKTEKVYAPYILKRTMEIWSKLTNISLPNDIRKLIEMTYSHREEEGELFTLKTQLANTREKLSRLALVGISKGGKTESDTMANTRYSECETIEVLLIKDMHHRSDGKEIQFLNGQKVFLPKETPSKIEKKKIAIQFMDNIVNVAEYIAPDALPIKQLSWLKDYLYIGKEDEDCLRIAKVLPSERITDFNEQSFSKKINYNPVIGYEERLNT